MIKCTKLVGICLLLLSLHGCKVQVSAPAGGSVISGSGNHNCASGRTCLVNVPGFGFSDTFTAVPKAGYVFTGWATGHRHFCAGETGSCVINPGPVASLESSDNSSLVKFYRDMRRMLADPQAIFYLRPVFSSEASRSATLSWSVPTTRANGSALAFGELAGYEIYITTEKSGTSKVIEIKNPQKISHNVSDLSPDTYHFAVSALDTNGLVSELSAVVTKTIR
ncbi:MAG: fibronectin type III domain-containing protein [Gammaproteobacteria bacterium]|nr:fibronectin type III domain-containing protein [Gammaproteobacteria bacterium]